VTLPAVALQQGDLPRVSQAVVKYIGLVSLFAFPALWGLSAVAPEVVAVLLGPKWLEAIPALVILPLIVPMRMVCSFMFTTSLALGNRSLDLRNTIANFVLLPGGFFVGAHWGLVGLCLAWLVAVPLSYTFSVPAVLRAIGIRAIDLVAECGPPAFAAGVMYAAVAGLRVALPEQPAIAVLGALVAGGALVYFAVLTLISRRHLVNALGFARRLVGSDAPGAA